MIQELKGKTPRKLSKGKENSSFERMRQRSSSESYIMADFVDVSLATANDIHALTAVMSRSMCISLIDTFLFGFERAQESC
jgi:hypothetical protein